MPSGTQLVSTTAITGIPNLFASETAMYSDLTSTTKSASGRPCIFLMPPKLRSNLIRSRSNVSDSFLFKRAF